MSDRFNSSPIGKLLEQTRHPAMEAIQALGATQAQVYLGLTVASRAVGSSTIWTAVSAATQAQHRISSLLGQSALFRSGHLGEQLALISASIRPLKELNQIGRTLLPATASTIAQVGKPHLAFAKQFATLAEPYAGLKTIMTLSPILANSFPAFRVARLFDNKFRFPVIDALFALELADRMSKEEIESQLQTLGVILSGPAIDSHAGDHADTDVTNESRRRRLALNPSTVMNLVFALLILWYQEWSSSQMEARLTAIETHNSAQASLHIEQLESLLMQYLEQQSAPPVRQFVNRERRAKIRETHNTRSQIVCEAFPNQLVEVIEEHGKWMLVEYYDWTKNSYCTGWTLKKYFKRLPLNRKKDLLADPSE